MQIILHLKCLIYVPFRVIYVVPKNKGGTRHESRI
nr:MAG TPA: hypothetical protein [Caudoviricetes sp.]